MIPHHDAPVTFGGLLGQLSYDDDSFGEIDPDIQRMFDGEEAALTADRVLLALWRDFVIDAEK